MIIHVSESHNVEGLWMLGIPEDFIDNYFYTWYCPMVGWTNRDDICTKICTYEVKYL